MFRTRALVAVSAVVVALAAPMLAAAPALAADPPGALGLDVGSDLIAVQPTDTLPGHLVVGAATTGATARTGVVVTDGAGANPVRLPDLTNVQSLALGPDGRTVYAASLDGVIATFSSDDLSTVATFETGDDTCPNDLAVASDGRVFFTEGCTAPYSLEVLDPTTKVITGVTVGLVKASSPIALRIENTVAAPDTMAVIGLGNWVDLIDVAGADPVDIGRIDPIGVETLAFAPDGLSVLVGGDVADFDRYSVEASPQHLGATFVGGYWPPDGIASSPDGTYVATSAHGTFESYGPSSSKPLAQYPGYDGTVGRSVAWLGDTLVTMLTDTSAHQVYVDLRADAIRAPTTLTIGGPTSVAINRAFTITGHLSDRGTTLGNVRLEVTHTDRTGARSLGTTQVGPLGNFFLHVSATNGLSNVWRVTYPGTTTHAANSALFRRVVARAPTALSLRTDHTRYTYGQIAHVAAHLGVTYANRRVAIYARQAGFAAHRLALGDVGPAGNLFASVRVTRNTTFSVSFTGDLRHVPAVVRLARPTAAQVTISQSGYYATSGSYRLYHDSGAPRLHMHVAPYKVEQCGYFYGEVYRSGQWRSVGISPCERLHYPSDTAVYYTGAHTVGERFRFLAVWFHGDGVNSDDASPWTYVQYTS